MYVRKVRSDVLEVGVPLRNVGRGPAFIRRAELVAGRAEPVAAATSRRVVLPVDDDTFITCTLREGEPFYDDLTRDQFEFAVALNYDDISGTQRTRSVMRIRQERFGQFEILGVGIYHCDENWRRELHTFAGYDPYASG